MSTNCRSKSSNDLRNYVYDKESSTDDNDVHMPIRDAVSKGPITIPVSETLKDVFFFTDAEEYDFYSGSSAFNKQHNLSSSAKISFNKSDSHDSLFQNTFLSSSDKDTITGCNEPETPKISLKLSSFSIGQERRKASQKFCPNVLQTSSDIQEAEKCKARELYFQELLKEPEVKPLVCSSIVTIKKSPRFSSSSRNRRGSADEVDNNYSQLETGCTTGIVKPSFPSFHCKQTVSHSRTIQSDPNMFLYNRIDHSDVESSTPPEMIISEEASHITCKQSFETNLCNAINPNDSHYKVSGSTADETKNQRHLPSILKRIISSKSPSKPNVASIHKSASFGSFFRDQTLAVNDDEKVANEIIEKPVKHVTSFELRRKFLSKTPVPTDTPRLHSREGKESSDSKASSNDNEYDNTQNVWNSDYQKLLKNCDNSNYEELTWANPKNTLVKYLDVEQLVLESQKELILNQNEYVDILREEIKMKQMQTLLESDNNLQLSLNITTLKPLNCAQLTSASSKIITDKTEPKSEQLGKNITQCSVYDTELESNARLPCKIKLTNEKDVRIGQLNFEQQRTHFVAEIVKTFEQWQKNVPMS